MTVDAQALKDKILEIYPELNKNQLEMNVSFDSDKGCWIINLAKGPDSLSTHLEAKDAEQCLEGEKCVYLGHQISEFIETYCHRRSSC